MEKTTKKKKSSLRLWIQAASFALSNGYLSGWAKGRIYTGDNKSYCFPGLNCYSCPGALASCPIGSLQAVLDSGQYKFSLYVFGIIGMMGMIFGRFICGWLCPFGLVQDLLYKIPLFKKRKNLPGHQYLIYLKYIILLVFVLLLPSVIRTNGVGSPWFCEFICPSGTLLGGIPLTLANEKLAAAIGPRYIWKVALLAVILFLSIKTYRPFCKYLCPLGALYGLANPVASYRLRVNTDTCVACGACQKACGMDIPVWKEPNSRECIRCGKCKAVCPQHAITSTWEDWRNKFTQPDPQSESKKQSSPAAHKIPGVLCLVVSVIMLIIILATLFMMMFLMQVTNSMQLSLQLPMLCGVVPIIALLVYAIRMVRSHGTYEETLMNRQFGWIVAGLSAAVALLSLLLLGVEFTLLGGTEVSAVVDFWAMEMATSWWCYVIPALLGLFAALLLKPANQSAAA